MDTIEAILSRRSVRKFTEEVVSEADIQELLRAAMAAPSAGNQQPWHFLVINDTSLLAKVKDINPNAGMTAHAPLGILVCGDMMVEKYQGNYWVQDCSAAAQNILLAAHAKGLGAVWTGIYPKAERVSGIRLLFGLPEHIIPLCLVVLGHPVQVPAPENRFKPERVHRNKFS